MPTVPSPEELGSLPRMPGSRPIGGYDLSSYAAGAREVADAGARFGQAIEGIGKATYMRRDRRPFVRGRDRISL